MDLSKWTPQSVLAILLPLFIAGMTAFYAYKGLGVPDWLTNLIVLLSGGGLFGIGHSAGARSTLNGAASTQPPSPTV